MARAVWCFFFFFKQKTAYEMRISDWSSDVCSSDLAIDDQFLGPLRNVGVEIVHQHPQRRFGEPALCVQVGAGRRLDDAAVVESRVEGAGPDRPFATSSAVAVICRRVGKIAGAGEDGLGTIGRAS